MNYIPLIVNWRLRSFIGREGISTSFLFKSTTLKRTMKYNGNQIDSSTIDGNVVFVHSQYSCILTSQVSTQFLCPTKLLLIVMIKCLSYSAILCFFIFCFALYLILKNMSTNVRKFHFPCYIWHLWRRV